MRGLAACPCARDYRPTWGHRRSPSEADKRSTDQEQHACDATRSKSTCRRFVSVVIGITLRVHQIATGMSRSHMIHSTLTTSTRKLSWPRCERMTCKTPSHQNRLGCPVSMHPHHDDRPADLTRQRQFDDLRIPRRLQAARATSSLRVRAARPRRWDTAAQESGRMAVERKVCGSSPSRTY